MKYTICYSDGRLVEDGLVFNNIRDAEYVLRDIEKETYITTGEEIELDIIEI